MSGISKRVSGSWVSGDYGIMKTATDTITTLPAVVYADGNNATVGISGNTVQSGTPTPDSPIMPQGTGDMSENLFYKKIANANITAQGKIISNGEFDMVVAKVTEGETYSVSGGSGVMGFYVSEPELGSTSYNNRRDYIVTPVTIPQDINYVAYRVSDRPDVAMFNSGSTALPFEPYGYKIPISSANTTTPVYLGEVETTRRIKKLVLNGTEEGWEKSATRAGCFALRGVGTGVTEKTMYCTHATYVSTASQLTSNNTCYMGNDFNLWLDLFDAQTTMEQFKTYLAQQYAAGTPVVVWYVLATETTGIVNEPIRKIGDYADTVSGITIPTITGADSFDVLTTLKPSEVTVNYKGWHSVADVHERENGAWT